MGDAASGPIRLSFNPQLRVEFRGATEVLAEEQNYRGLTRVNADLVQHAAARSHRRRVTLDLDSSESPVHGAQEQAAYNGHFESVCYHPLFVFNPKGNCGRSRVSSTGCSRPGDG